MTQLGHRNKGQASLAAEWELSSGNGEHRVALVALSTSWEPAAPVPVPRRKGRQTLIPPLEFHTLTDGIWWNREDGTNVILWRGLDTDRDPCKPSVGRLARPPDLVRAHRGSPAL